MDSKYNEIVLFVQEGIRKQGAGFEKKKWGGQECIGDEFKSFQLLLVIFRF